MKFLIFLILIFCNLTLVLATIILKEKFYLSLTLLIVFVILLLVFLYYSFYLKILTYYNSFSKIKIKKIIKLFILFILSISFILFLINLKLLKNQKTYIANEINKEYISYVENFEVELIYIKDDKYKLVKNYLDELKLLFNNLKYEIIDSVFDFEAYKELNKNFSSTLNKGNLVIKLEDKHTVISNVNILNIVFSILSLTQGKKKICVIGDENKSIYNFNEEGLAVFSKIIEDGGFELLEFNIENCDICLIYNLNTPKYDHIKNNKNKIYILKEYNSKALTIEGIIKPNLKELSSFAYYGKNLISKFSTNSLLNNLKDELIAGEAYKIKGSNLEELAYIKDENYKDNAIMVKIDGNTFISAPNILSNLYMQNPGNQDFARFLIYGYYDDYSKILNKNNDNTKSFISSYRYLKYIKIALFIISPVLILLSGIIILKKEYFL